jgi:hypothetical protein
MSHVTRHTSHVTRHTSHVTRHTSHVTRHTSHNTPLSAACVGGGSCIRAAAGAVTATTLVTCCCCCCCCVRLTLMQLKQQLSDSLQSSSAAAAASEAAAALTAAHFNSEIEILQASAAPPHPTSLLCVSDTTALPCCVCAALDVTCCPPRQAKPSFLSCLQLRSTMLPPATSTRMRCSRRARA